MSDRRTGSRRPWALLCVAMLFACVAAAPAQADSYGELAHFAEGQLESPEYAFGVNTQDNSVYVVDQIQEGKFFRIQKFEEDAGTKKYAVVASATFKPKDPTGEEEDEVEGVAIDPTLKRVYVMSVEVRACHEHCDEKLDPEALAAGQIFAFSTEQKGSKLEFDPATAEGEFVGTKVLEPLSNKLATSLLEPSGIAVDPTNHDLIVAAQEDRGKIEEERTLVLQRIDSSGKLGARYVDSRVEENPETHKTEEKSFFEECLCNSPVVSSTGHVYLLGEQDEIDEIPADFSSSAAPKQVFEFNCEQESEEEELKEIGPKIPGCGFREKLTQFPGPNPTNGSQLSIGAEGNIYVRARIKLASENNIFNGGVLVLGSDFTEQGWTGGASGASESQKCAVPEIAAAAVVAAGKEQKVFSLSRVAKTPTKGPRIVEFGPGGGGCPKGTTDGITATAGGVETESIPISKKATLTTHLTQANALKVEWDFGDGSTQTVEKHKREQQTTSVEHLFLKSGKLTVLEKIHTDDMANPVIEVEKKLTIVGGTPTIAGEEANVEGTSVTLKGTINPNGKQTECRFEYGKASEGYGLQAPCPSPGAGQEAKEVSTLINGLAKHTEYHFRIWAKNANGEETGGETKFRIGPAPSAQTLPASSIGQTTATVSGSVNPEGEASECHFDYGPTLSYGAQAPCSSIPGGGEGAVAESAALSGLKAGTTYHYRIVASNLAEEASFGKDATFITSSSPPPPPPPPPPSEKGKGEVEDEHKTKPVPAVTIAGASISVSATGVFTLKVGCPAEETSCVGTVTVRTLSAVAATMGHQAKSKKRKAILTLATGAFTVAGGKVKALTLHLSAKARALLVRSHTLRVRVTIAAHDTTGGAHTTVASITLRAPKAHGHK